MQETTFRESGKGAADPRGALLPAVPAPRGPPGPSPARGPPFIWPSILRRPMRRGRRRAPRRPGRIAAGTAAVLVLLLLLGGVVGSERAPGPGTGTSDLRPLVRGACGGTPNLTIQSSTSSGAAPLIVNFTAVIVGGCAPFSVDWEFGDGAEGNGTHVAHQFASAGTFQVVADLSSNGTGEAEASTTVVVTGGPGAFQLSVSAQPLSGPAPLPVTFWANITGGNAPADLEIHWTFGAAGNGTGTPIPFLFRTPGTYLVTASAELDTGASVRTNVTVMVGPSRGGLPVNLSVRATPSRAVAPASLSLAVDSNGAAPGSLLVCFGDGTPCASGPVAWNGSYPVGFVHRYSTPGNFAIIATLSNASGAIAVASTSASILTGNPVSVEASVVPPAGAAPSTARFSATVLGGTPPYTLQWSFGDGTIGASVPGAPVDHTYAAGRFAVTVTVKDAAGQESNATLSAFTVPPPSGPLGLPSGWFSGPIPLYAWGLVGAAGIAIAWVLRRARRRSRMRAWKREGEELVREMHSSG
jgi:PKD repeat protein